MSTLKVTAFVFVLQHKDSNLLMLSSLRRRPSGKIKIKKDLFIPWRPLNEGNRNRFEMFYCALFHIFSHSSSLLVETSYPPSNRTWKFEAGGRKQGQRSLIHVQTSPFKQRNPSMCHSIVLLFPGKTKSSFHELPRLSWFEVIGLSPCSLRRQRSVGACNRAASSEP